MNKTELIFDIKIPEELFLRIKRKYKYLRMRDVVVDVLERAIRPKEGLKWNLNQMMVLEK